MKAILLTVLLFAAPAIAQERLPSAAASGGCGPSSAHFDVTTNSKEHAISQPESGKALVYVFEDIERGPTMRVGVDGAWVGANKGKSYFFFSVEPGDHQLCTNWQSGVFKETAKRVGAATAFTAEAGKVYYFRTQVYERSERDMSVKIEPVESAEGQFLISASAFSTFRAKK